MTDITNRGKLVILAAIIWKSIRFHSSIHNLFMVANAFPDNCSQDGKFSSVMSVMAENGPRGRHCFTLPWDQNWNSCGLMLDVKIVTCLMLRRPEHHERLLYPLEVRDYDVS